MVHHLGHGGVNTNVLDAFVGVDTPSVAQQFQILAEAVDEWDEIVYVTHDARNPTRKIITL